MFIFKYIKPFVTWFITWDPLRGSMAGVDNSLGSRATFERNCVSICSKLRINSILDVAVVFLLLHLTKFFG